MINPYQNFLNQTSPQYNNQQPGYNRQPQQPLYQQPQYYNQPQQVTPEIPQQEIIKVNGENGANAFQMGKNSSVLLLDATQPVIWLKTTDGAGYPSISGYQITPLEDIKKAEEATLESRVKNIEDFIKQLGGSNNVQQSNAETSTDKPKSKPKSAE